MTTHTLRLILGDQLNAAHSWFRETNPNRTYLITELKQETDYTTHHIQKVQAFFAAMEQFANALEKAGHKVIYLTLDQTAGYPDLPSLINSLIKLHGFDAFEYQQPDEYRLAEQLSHFCATLALPSRLVETEHFYLQQSELADYFQANCGHKLEHFYRKMRTRFNLLMDDLEQPLGGQWNYDQQNRKKLKTQDIADIPTPLLFANDVTSINERLRTHVVDTIGLGEDKLLWPINRQQSLQLLHFFCNSLLPKFGQFQDAMTCQAESLAGDLNWSLYHSRLSFALNSKMLSPQQVVDAAIHAFHQSKGAIELAQIEGFVRQILGWREFVRGIYWANMPNYKTLDHLQTSRPIPSWFWNAKTDMNCLRHAIGQSLQYGYAHHIQRLMVTGNFCLLAGIDVDQVDNWYLGIYVDAIEWVELPNTRGMSQYADGGLLGSKAYAASGNYLNKMSDYCSHCQYSVKEVSTKNACPLTSLYWNFMHQHQEKFRANPRQAMVYRNWDKKSDEQQQKILAKAQQYLAKIEEL
jgi:deoxyribodipyrimidine photolyase-related protein